MLYDLPVTLWWLRPGSRVAVQTAVRQGSTCFCSVLVGSEDLEHKHTLVSCRVCEQVTADRPIPFLGWAGAPADMLSAALSLQVGNNDVDDVNIIVFRQINQFDLSGNVVTSSEYLSTLWVRPAPLRFSRRHICPS